MRDVLVDQAQTVRRVDHDVAHAILADHAAAQVAQIDRRRLFDQRRRNGRLHDGRFLEQRRELGVVGARSFDADQ